MLIAVITVIPTNNSILESGKENKIINLRSECKQPEYFSEEENIQLLIK